MVSRYQKRISGPLLDRADPGSDNIHMDVPCVEAAFPSRTKSCRTIAWASPRSCSSRTGAIQARVEAARERQRRRFKGQSGLLANADMGPAEVRDFCQVDDAGASLLRAAMKQLHMSARAYDELSWSSPHPEAGADDCRSGGE